MPEQKTINGGRQEEINLLNLFIILLKHKWLIIFIVLGTSLLTFLYLNLSARRMDKEKSIADLQLENIYYSDCILRPDSVKADELISLMKRRNFALKMVEENKLGPLIQEAMAERKPQQGAATASASQATYDWLEENLFVSSSQNLVTVGFTARNTDLPSAIIGAYLSSLSEYFRHRDLENWGNRRKFFLRQLDITKDTFIKARISEQILKLMDAEAIARTKKDYGFDLMDAPSSAEKVRIIRTANEKKVERMQKPLPVQVKSRKNLMIFLLMGMASLVIAVSLAFLFEYFETLKKIEPEKVKILRKYLSIRHKKN